MRHEMRKIDMPATGLNGVATEVKDLTDTVVRIDGTGAAAFSVKVQGKISGPDDLASDVWFDVSGALTASALVPLDRIATADLGGYSMPFTHVRIVSTTTGAPAPVAAVAGRNTRTDH